MKKKLLFMILTIVFAVNLVAVLPVLAMDQMQDQMVMDEGEMMGPTIAGKMLHAWVSLAAAIIIFILAFKFMLGHQMSRPITLIGFGALADALIGLMLTPENHMQNMWLGGLIFSSSVVLGILWIGKIFENLKASGKK